MNVLVLGASGLLGHVVLRALTARERYEVVGTVRSSAQRSLFPASCEANLIVTPDLEEVNALARLLEEVRPAAVINCLSVRRALGESGSDLSRCIRLYSVLPRRLAQLCRNSGARLVQISSDGVFSGRTGGYTENDCPDAEDPYGVAKMLGEVSEPPAITIRTSMIGHELAGRAALLEWFLAQSGECRCHARAIFSGLPAVILAEILRDIVLPRADLTGLFHIGSRAITKCELLRLVAKVYRKDIRIVSDERLVVNRSLNCEKFRRATGYVAPEWPELIQIMHSYYTKSSNV